MGGGASSFSLAFSVCWDKLPRPAAPLSVPLEGFEPEVNWLLKCVVRSYRSLGHTCFLSLRCRLCVISVALAMFLANAASGLSCVPNHGAVQVGGALWRQSASSSCVQFVRAAGRERHAERVSRELDTCYKCILPTASFSHGCLDSVRSCCVRSAWRYHGLLCFEWSSINTQFRSLWISCQNLRAGGSWLKVFFLFYL